MVVFSLIFQEMADERFGLQLSFNNQTGLMPMLTHEKWKLVMMKKKQVPQRKGKISPKSAQQIQKLQPLQPTLVLVPTSPKH